MRKNMRCTLKSIHCPKRKILRTKYISDKQNPLNYSLYVDVDLCCRDYTHFTASWNIVLVQNLCGFGVSFTKTDRSHLSLRKQWDEGDKSRHFRGMVLPESRCMSSGTELILYVFKSSAKKNQTASQILDCASAKPQAVASRKYMPEKKTFKALWKVSYCERFTILLGLSFENKAHNVNIEKPYCF